MVLDSLRHDGVGFSMDRAFQDRYRLSVERRTPTLDRLAKDGAVFTQAFSTASYTTSAHASLLTSRYPSEHRVESLFPSRLAADLPTLALLLRDMGYHTVHAIDFERHFSESDLNRGAQTVLCHDDQRLLEYLRRLRENFFLFVHFGDIHSPYLHSFVETAASKVYRKVYNELRRRYGVPELDSGFIQSVAQARVNRWPRHHQIPRWVFDDFSTLRIAMQMEGQYFRSIYPYYQQGINHFDQGRFARLISQLERGGLLEDTLLVVTSDHGEGPVSDNFFGHGLDLSDSVLHVPLFFRYERAIRSGARISTPVSLLDIMPTILDIAGARSDKLTFRGLCLSDALRDGRDIPTDRGLYAENWRSLPLSIKSGQEKKRMLAHRALRTDRYKLVIQGRDLEGDESVLNLVKPDLDLVEFVRSVNHRYMGLANEEPLSAWLRANKRQAPMGQDDVLTDILSLARQTLGQDRYRIQHMRRLRSFLAQKFQQHWKGGALDIPALVRDLYEVYFVEFPAEPIVQKISVLIQHQCRTLEDIMSLFEQMGPYRERYQLFDLQQDPFEEVNLFGSGLSVVQERDALAMEILLMEAFLKERSPLRAAISREEDVIQQSPMLEAIG